MEHILDVRKLLCPLPVIRVGEKIKTLSQGEHLLVIATDPGVLYDIPSWCKMHGYNILHTEKKGNEIIIKIGLKE